MESILNHQAHSSPHKIPML